MTVWDLNALCCEAVQPARLVGLSQQQRTSGGRRVDAPPGPIWRECRSGRRRRNLLYPDALAWRAGAGRSHADTDAGGCTPTTLTVQPPIAIPAEPLSISGTPRRGSAEAPVVLIEYSDHECPYCAAFEMGSLQVIKRQYVETGKVALVYRHLPLAALHPHATRAAEAAVCAAAQERFWELHDVLFANRQALDEAALERHATAAGLDLEAWRACMADGSAAREVAAHAAEAARLGLTGTPSPCSNAGTMTRQTGLSNPSISATARRHETCWPSPSTVGPRRFWSTRRGNRTSSPDGSSMRTAGQRRASRCSSIRRSQLSGRRTSKGSASCVRRPTAGSSAARSPWDVIESLPLRGRTWGR